MADAEPPEEAVLVYIPDTVREPLPSDVKEYVEAALSGGEWPKNIVSIAEVQDTAWYAQNANRAAAALHQVAVHVEQRHAPPGGHLAHHVVAQKGAPFRRARLQHE